MAEEMVSVTKTEAISSVVPREPSVMAFLGFATLQPMPTPAPPVLHSPDALMPPGYLKMNILNGWFSL